jgi:hypothetical protein
MILHGRDLIFIMASPPPCSVHLLLYSRGLRHTCGAAPYLFTGGSGFSCTVLAILARGLEQWRVLWEKECKSHLVSLQQWVAFLNCESLERHFSPRTASGLLAAEFFLSTLTL